MGPADYSTIFMSMTCRQLVTKVGSTLTTFFTCSKFAKMYKKPTSLASCSERACPQRYCARLFLERLLLCIVECFLVGSFAERSFYAAPCCSHWAHFPVFSHR